GSDSATVIGSPARAGFGQGGEDCRAGRSRGGSTLVVAGESFASAVTVSCWIAPRQAHATPSADVATSPAPVAATRSVPARVSDVMLDWEIVPTGAHVAPASVLRYASPVALMA